jgi:hypothetical protein
MRVFSVSAALVILCWGSSGLGFAEGKHIKVKSSPIERLSVDDYTNRSLIEFTGGLVLSSSNEHFGGWSGLVTLPSNEGRQTKVTAVSDVGWWLDMAVNYDKNNNKEGQELDLFPVNCTHARLRPLLDESGEPLYELKKGWSDAESVILEKKFDDPSFDKDTNSSSSSSPPPPLLVSFERNHRIWRYADTRAPATTDASLSLASALLNANCPLNGGAEAIEVLPGLNPSSSSLLVMFCEDALEHHVEIFPGWFIPLEGEEKYENVYLRITDTFRPTDFAVLETGDLLILQRMFNGKDLGMRLELVPHVLLRAARALPNSVLVPARLLEVWQSPENQIDNMEGMSVDYLDNNNHLNPGQRALRISIISDDNFSKTKQKTLLLTFGVKDTEELLQFAEMHSRIETFPGTEKSSTSTSSPSSLQWLQSLSVTEVILIFVGVFVLGCAIGSGMVAVALRVKRKKNTLLSQKYTSLEMTQRGDKDNEDDPWKAEL